MKGSLKWVGQTGHLAVCLLAVVYLGVAGPALAGARLELISVSSTGEQGNADSAPLDDYVPLGVSADGRFVAFGSLASNLVPGDSNGVEDIFVRDRLLGVTERVSVGNAGEQANGPSANPSISADGRFVAFASAASNLVPGDANGCSDAFVHDRTTGATELASVTTTGQQGDDSSGAEAISPDGRFVAFNSYASNLTPEYDHIPWDRRLYLRDRLAGTTELITVDPAGRALEGDFGRPAMSADGRLIAFESYGWGQNESMGPHMRSDVFLRDREAMTTEVATLSETGEAGDGTSAFLGSMSADGRFIAFVSNATNLVPGTYIGWGGVFVRDRVAETIECAGEGREAVISGDGRTVVFTSSGGEWLSLWNRRTGSIEDMCCFSNSWAGRVDDPWISYDGRVVAFSSSKPPYMGVVDTNNARDVFVWQPLFPDMDYDHWASDEIQACAKWDIIVGYPDGLYHPEFEVTRDQIAVDIARVLAEGWGDTGIPDPEPPPTFSDVPPDFWAYKHIEYTVSQNVADGYGDGTYQPTLTVDRGQMAVYIARALVAPTGEAAIADPEAPFAFPDVPGDDNAWLWCLKHVEYLAGRGLVEGYEDGLYHPESAVTRDQLAVITARAFELTLGFHPMP